MKDILENIIKSEWTPITGIAATLTKSAMGEPNISQEKYTPKYFANIAYQAVCLGALLYHRQIVNIVENIIGN